MSKDYLCKDCQFNNNGWCKKKSIQGLKNITECEFKNNSTVKDEEEFDNGMYKQFGKREMLHNIQMQMLGIENDSAIEDKFKTLKQVMVSLEKMLLAEESIHGIAIEYSIDEDIHKDSMAISDEWLNEVGQYIGN